MSDDEYPSNENLDRIQGWKFEKPGDFEAFRQFVFSLWHWPDCATVEGGMWRLATGGWSGNEDIIGAMRRNFTVAALLWQRSERGGLHWYKPPDEQEYFGGNER